MRKPICAIVSIVFILVLVSIPAISEFEKVSVQVSASKSNKVLKFANASMDETIASFCEANRDIDVEFSSHGIWRAEDLMNTLLTKDSDVDIIQLYAGSGLTRIMEKGYFTDLSHSKIISDRLASMYPQIIDAVTYDGRIAAIPSEMTVHLWRIDENALKKDTIADMGDWADIVEDAATNFDLNDSTYSLFPPGTNKDLLLYDILVQYIVENESVDDFKFCTPELKSIIEEILDLPETVFISENLEAGIASADDEGFPPMFSLMESFSIYRYKRFYKQYTPKPVAPPSFFSSNRPVIRGTLSVYMISPFSKNQNEAIAFLEYVTQNMQPEICFMTQKGYSEPIANLTMTHFENDVNSTISTLEKQLETVEETERASIIDAIQAEKISLEYIHNNYWLISREDIEAYQELSQYISFMPSSFCFTDSTYSQTTINLWDNINQLLNGESDVEVFLKKLDQVYSMVRLESVS